MKKTLSTVVMLIILIFALSTDVQAYTMSFTGTTEVESGATFNVTISVDEATTLANGQLSYDSSLFTFVGATQDNNMTAQAYPSEGKVKWMYTELKTEPVGVKSFVFTFKAAEVEETKKGTFTLNDFIVTTATDTEYDQESNTISGSNSVEITINKKVAEPTWTLTPSEDFELEIGDTKIIETDGDVTWTTSDSKVATVDKNGKITAVGTGTATITATDKDGNTKSIKVTVVKKDELTLTPSGSVKLETGDTKTIKTNKDVTWTTSDSKVATVDKNGKITAVGTGTATITATDKDGNKKTITITVTAKNTASGKKDNTISNTKIPQTGEDFTRFVCLGIASVILATGLVFKKKAKNLDKIFVILPLVAIMSISGAVNAIKIVDDQTMKAGIFAKGEILDNANVIAVSPSKDFPTDNTLSVETLKSLLNNDRQQIVSVVDAEGEEIDLEAKTVPTGAVAKVSPITGENVNTTQKSIDYTVLLYGDANGDGKICNCLDVNIIRQDYVFNNKAEGVYKLAADLYADGTLNVRDVQRMVKKYLGTLESSVVTPFPGEKEIVLNPKEDNITLKIGEQITITSDDPNVTWSWNSNNESAYVSTTVDGAVTITGTSCGTIDLTVTDENGNEKTITITVVGGEIIVKEATTSTITVKASLDIEGKEIASVKHFYRVQPGFTKNPSNEWSEVADITTEEYAYTTNTLKVNYPYQFMAEITTTDGETYKTNNVAWIMGTATGEQKPGEEPTLYPSTDFEIEVNESQKITADADVEWSWDEDSDVAEVEVNDDGSLTITGKLPGTIDITATDENGNQKTITVTVVVATGETNDESEAVAQVESTRKMYKTVQYAVDATETTDTVTMLQNSTEAVTIPEEKNITLDLNGKTLNVSEKGTILTINSTKFTMKNGAEVQATLSNGTGLGIYVNNVNAEITLSDDIHYERNAVQTIENFEGTLTVNNALWVGSASEAFIEDKGAGTINIYGGNYSGYVRVIAQSGAGTITIGDVNKTITDKSPYLFARDSIVIAENSTLNFYNGKAEFRGVTSYVGDLSGTRTDSFLYTTYTSLYYVPLMAGETLDETEAVAQLVPDYRLFKTLQDATNAAEGGSVVQLLKDVKESFMIPKFETGITLDLNGHSITGVNEDTAAEDGYTIKVEGDLVISNSSETESTIYSGAPIQGGYNNIYVTGSANLTIKENIKISQTAWGYDVVKDGIGNIIIDGATIEGFNGSIGINDIGDSGNIYIYSGNVNGYAGAIKKIGKGNIYIGKDSVSVDGLDGTQENILTSVTTPKLILSGATCAICTGDTANVYWFNGELQSTYNNEGNYLPIFVDVTTLKSKEFAGTRTGAVVTSGNGNHSFIFAEETAIATVETGTATLLSVFRAVQ